MAPRKSDAASADVGVDRRPGGHACRISTGARAWQGGVPPHPRVGRHAVAARPCLAVTSSDCRWTSRERALPAHCSSCLPGGGAARVLRERRRGRLDAGWVGRTHARPEPWPGSEPLVVALRATLTVEFIYESERSLLCV